MPYNIELADRIRLALDDIPNVVAKKMFGGVGYMVQGNLACGVHKQSMIVRLGPERYEEAATMPEAHPFDLTGRPMKGWLIISPEGVQDEATLKRLVGWSLEHVKTLPPK